MIEYKNQFESVGYFIKKDFVDKILIEKVKNKDISYRLSTEQGYSFYNHLSWYFTNKPKTTGIVGGDNFTNEIISTFKQNNDIEQSLRELILKFDNEYKKVFSPPPKDVPMLEDNNILPHLL